MSQASPFETTTISNYELQELKDTARNYEELVQAILGNAPEGYDCDDAEHTIIIRYVRDLEELRDKVLQGIPVAILQAARSGY